MHESNSFRSPHTYQFWCKQGQTLRMRTLPMPVSSGVQQNGHSQKERFRSVTNYLDLWWLLVSRRNIFSDPFHF
jgi:hypothetical protein